MLWWPLQHLMKMHIRFCFKNFFYHLNFQIVRADLQELHDLDLKGAPYGYTPFCSDRKEMDGFRFVLNISVECIPHFIVIQKLLNLY